MRYLLHTCAAILAILAWFNGSPGSVLYTVSFVTLAGIIAIFQCIISAQDLKSAKKLQSSVEDVKEKTNRIPKLELSWNDKVLNGNDTVVIREDKNIFPIILKLGNNGLVTAKNIQLQFQAPDIFGNIWLGNKWYDHGLIDTIIVPPLYQERALRQISFIAPEPIHPGNYQILSNGSTSGLVDNAETVLVKLRLSCDDLEERVFNVHVEFSDCRAKK